MDDREKLKQKLQEGDGDRSLSITARQFKQRNNPEVFKTYISTGYKALDEVLGGGLTPGVHYIGAISSAGKSTYCLQMADYMAAHGQKVVYVSLEMQKVDLTAKLVSMYTMLENAPMQKLNPKLIDFNETKGFLLAKSSHQLTSKTAAAKFSAAEWDLIEKSAATVEEHGANINVLESIERPASIDEIELYMEAYVQLYGVAPVLFVDYLQILSPSKTVERCTDKQAVDNTVAKFRIMAKKYNTPVIVISSFNRASYDTKASMQDFKESGNIEYSADTLLALQLAGVGGNGFDVDKAKRKYPREIELCVLKNRYGPTGDKIKYNFSTTYNYFDEVGLVVAATKPVKSI